LGASNLTGNLTVTSGGAVGDDVIQTGPLVVGKVTKLSAGLADIVLGDTDNNFNTLAVTNGANVTVTDANALVLGASNAGTLNVTANGAISQTAALTVTTAANLDAGAANDIVLLNAANSLSPISIGSARNVSLRNNAGLDFGTSSIGGTLGVTAAGNIGQSAGATLEVGGKSTLSVGDPTSQNVALANSGNKLGEVAVVKANDVTLTNGDALILGASAISGNLFVTVEATASGGLSQSGALVVKGSTSLATGLNDVDLSTQAGNDFVGGVAVVGHSISLKDINAIDLGDSAIGGDLSVSAGGNITQASATTGLNVTGDATLATSLVGDIDLSTASANSFGSTTANFVAVTQARNVSLASSSDLYMGTCSVSRDLSVTSGGSLYQLGTLTVGTTLMLNVAADVDLSDVGNGIVAVVITTADDVSLVTATSLDLGATNAATLTVSSGGSITDSGNVSVTGKTNLTAAAGIALNQAASAYAGALWIAAQGGDVSVVNNTATILGDCSATGNLTITVTGPNTLTNDDAGLYGKLSVGGDAVLDDGANTMSLNQSGWNYHSLLLICGTLIPLP
jgi:hypothetical protein